MNWEAFFTDVPDFRLRRCKKHNLLDILVIALLAVICGADDFEEIALYGRHKENFLKTFLDLPNGIPSHDTAPAARIQPSLPADGQKSVWSLSAPLVEPDSGYAQ